jgi:pyruvate ferredoxin oxidoreductase gamma subunit
MDIRSDIRPHFDEGVIYSDGFPFIMPDIDGRIVGRGGQGAVMAARMFAEAAYLEGFKGVQAFPFFGAERRGAPVQAFLRISDKEILTMGQVYEPDLVVVLDEHVMQLIDALAGLKKGGLVIVNTAKGPDALKIDKKDAVLGLVDATSIAFKYGILSSGMPVSNTSILGAVARASGLISMGSVDKAIYKTFSKKDADKNAAAAKEAYDTTKMYNAPEGVWKWKD